MCKKCNKIKSNYVLIRDLAIPLSVARMRLKLLEKLKIPLHTIYLYNESKGRTYKHAIIYIEDVIKGITILEKKYSKNKNLNTMQGITNLKSFKNEIEKVLK